MDSPMVEIAAHLVRFTAELTCLLCGRCHGSLDGGSSWPPQREALRYKPGVDQPTPITGWWRLRCSTCGGALMATEVTSHSVRRDAAMDCTTKGIPRGRPPNWLVAERGAANVQQSHRTKGDWVRGGSFPEADANFLLARPSQFSADATPDCPRSAPKEALLPSGEVIPYAHFFTPSLSVKDVMKEAIDKEGKPLTDHDIQEHLKAQGIHIARRTVSKYREQLDILPSALR